MNSGKYLAFDIEIAKVFPDDEEDWDKHRPFGISCAATLAICPGADPSLGLWYGGSNCVEWGPFEMLPAQMDEEDCGDLVQYLANVVYFGYTIVTWNGLGFDFDVLAEEAPENMRGLIEELALSHIDIGWQMFCERGFMCGLDSAAKGLGVKGKTEGMSGSLAPKMWAVSRQEQDKVLEYVAQDVRTTAAVYDKLLEVGELSWITKAGTPSRNPWIPNNICGGSLMSVEEAGKLSVPNVKWMKDPWKRSKFTSWLTEENRCRINH